MNCEQVGLVVETWRRASDQSYRLRVALSDRLPGTHTERGRRIGWIIDAVSALAPMLDRPSSFGEAARGLIRRRRPVTMAALGDDQAALLGALDELVGPLAIEQQRAWNLALRLFEETIASECLDPFGECGHGEGGAAAGAP